jgi:hypothetical protein
MDIKSCNNQVYKADERLADMRLPYSRLYCNELQHQSLRPLLGDYVRTVGPLFHRGRRLPNKSVQSMPSSGL